MNTEILTKLANWLSRGAKHQTVTFDMKEGITFHKTKNFDPKNIAACKTSCCIAGAAVMFYNEVQKLADDYPRWVKADAALPWRAVFDEAGEVLGLTEDQALSLFTPQADYLGVSLLYFNDPKWAARTIRRLIKTGKVDWLATAPKEKKATLVTALNATAAIRKVKLHSSEYIAEVRMTGRES